MRQLLENRRRSKTMHHVQKRVLLLERVQESAPQAAQESVSFARAAVQPDGECQDGVKGCA